MAPLVKAFILLADAAKADVQKLPDEYRAQVGGEDLDEETLTAQISAYATTIEANQTSVTSLGKTEPMTDAVQTSINNLNDAITSDTAAKTELEEKLLKLREYDAQSSGFFSDIAALESAVTTGLSQLQAGVTSFNGTFTLPSQKELEWTKTVNSQWEDREAKLAKTNMEQSAEELANAGGITYSEALDWLISGKKPIGISKKALTLYNKYVTYKGEMRFINGRNITVDSKGRVRMGSKQINLYNRDTGRVYANRTAKTFESVTGEEDIRKTNIGRGVQSTGWKNALGDAKISAKNTFKTSLNITNDFNWKDTSKLTKWGKTAKGLGAVGTVLSVGGNIKEHFFDDKSSSVGEKIRNFAIDQGVDTVSGAGAAAAGAAIGTMVGGPLGTVVGVAAGIGISWLMEQKIPGLGKSATNIAKDALKGATDVIGDGFNTIAGWFN